MKSLRLKRFLSDDQGTFGALFHISPDGECFLCFTAEPPWRNNARGQSCIPAGKYRGELAFSPRFRKRLYELQGVPDRSEILIHTGNFAGDESKGFRTDTEGCILVGKDIGDMGFPVQRAVKHSTECYFQLLTSLHEEPIELEIRQ